MSINSKMEFLYRHIKLPDNVSDILDFVENLHPLDKINIKRTMIIIKNVIDDLFIDVHVTKDIVKIIRSFVKSYLSLIESRSMIDKFNYLEVTEIDNRIQISFDLKFTCMKYDINVILYYKIS